MNNQNQSKASHLQRILLDLAEKDKYERSYAASWKVPHITY